MAELIAWEGTGHYARFSFVFRAQHVWKRVPSTYAGMPQYETKHLLTRPLGMYNADPDDTYWELLALEFTNSRTNMADTYPGLHIVLTGLSEAIDLHDDAVREGESLDVTDEYEALYRAYLADAVNWLRTLFPSMDF